MASTILVVDDEARIRKLVSTFLERRGYLVQTASDGQEAIALIEANQPQLIITDINMPHLSGLELIKWVRAKLETITMPIIVLSAHSNEHGNQANAFLPKPVELSALITVVERLLPPVEKT